MKRLRCLLGICFLAVAAAGQNPYGTWQDHFSYANATRLADAGDKIFCATEGGLFYVDQESNSINKITSNDGLNDVAIQAIAWHNTRKTLLVAYKNSNIDLVTEKRIINLGDIKRKLLSGDKTIHNILFHEEDAYLACGFGIVVINLAANEIRDTYIIGESGSQVKVFDVETDGSTLYAATEKGILSAPIDHPNLLDYRNWQPMVTPRPGGKFKHLALAGGKLVAVYTRDQYDGDEAYRLVNGEWQRILTEVPYFVDMDVSGGFLTATAREEVFVYDLSFSLVSRIREYKTGTFTLSPIQPGESQMAGDGSLWVADHASGLMHVTGQQAEQILPAGPMSNAIFSLTAFRDQLWVSEGGRTDPWNNQFRAPLFQRLQEGEWHYFSKKGYPEMNGFFDMVQVVVDPAEPGHIFAASWGGGVLEFKDDQFVKRYNNQNSPLQTAIPDQPQEPYTRIGGLAFDSKNTLWITNSQSSKGLHSLSTGGRMEKL